MSCVLVCCEYFSKTVFFSATENFQKLQQAYGDSVFSRAQFLRRFKAYSKGRESIEDKPRNGRPSTIKKWRKYRQNLKLCPIWSSVDGHCPSYFDQWFGEICAKMVPKILSQDQKDNEAYLIYLPILFLCKYLFFVLYIQMI